MSYYAWAQQLQNGRALQKLMSRDRSSSDQRIAMPWPPEEVKYFQSSGRHNLPKKFLNHIKQAGGVQHLVDGFCVPIKFESLSLHSQRQQHCCRCLHCQLLFLSITHFSGKAEPKRTNLKTVWDVMVIYEQWKMEVQKEATWWLVWMVQLHF